MPEKAKPAVAARPGGHRDLLATNWKPFAKKTLKGYFNITLPNEGLIIHGCSVHEKDDSRWVGVPSRQYTTPTGETTWKPMVDFPSKEARYDFQAAALEALDKLLAEGGFQ